MKHQSVQKKLRSLQILAFNYRFQICKTLALLSVVYILLSIFHITVLMAFGTLFASIFGILFFKWKNLKEKGIINLASQKTKQTLLKRSFYDIYRDLIYYPYVTKIIGVFVRGAITKPHPYELDDSFQQLPQNIKAVIFKKGILSLAPEKIARLVTEKQASILDSLENDVEPEPKPKKQNKPMIQQKVMTVLPKNFGKNDMTWDRIRQYETEEFKIHEQTVAKQMLVKLNDKIQWRHIVGLAAILSFILTRLKSKKLGKILMYNGGAIGIIILFALVFIKYKHPGQIKSTKSLESQLKK